MNTGRLFGGLLIAASLVGVIGGTYFMARRVDHYNTTQLPARWHVQESLSREFEFKGRKVSVSDDQTAAGHPALRLRYGDQEVVIPTHRPPVANLPDLGGYKEWFAVLAFCPIVDGQFNVNWFSGEGVKLVAIVRDTAGFDEDTWGSVRIKDWLFHLYELRDDGTINHRLMQFPDRKGKLPALAENKDRAVEQIPERSIEWQAALYAIPQTQISRYRYKTDAITGNTLTEGMGWTLPVAGFSAMGVALGVIVMAVSGGKRRGAAASGR